MDGRQYTCAVGENTTAQDIVQRLCRSRKVDEGGNQVTLVSDPSEWALFEAQRHDVSDPCHAGSTGVVPNTSLHKLERRANPGPATSRWRSRHDAFTVLH